VNGKEKEPVAIGLFDCAGHLTPSALAALCRGRLYGDAALAALDHIGCCAVCADDYAAVLEQGVLFTPPAGFAEELQRKLMAQAPVAEPPADMSSAQTPQKNPPAETAPAVNPRRSLSFSAYALRVAVAAAIALVVTFSGFGMTGKNGTAPPAAPDFSFVNAVSNGLKTFSQNVLNLEVFKYAEAKK
jgi:hypothetical protein